MLECNCNINNDELIKKVSKDMVDDEVFFELADFFKVFGDSTRIKIIYVLLKSEMCVCDIAEVLGMTQSAISHQLRVLRGSKLVKYRKEGKTVFYSLDDDHVKNIIDQGYLHISHN